jgi:K+-transporting ATPase ATPase C chain
VLNIMRLATPHSAVLSAVIFKRTYHRRPDPPRAPRRPVSTHRGRRRPAAETLDLRGVGSVIVPFLGINLIDMVWVALGLAWRPERRIDMRGLLRPTSVPLAFLTAVTGLRVLAVGHQDRRAPLPWQANGRLTLKDGTPVGSTLIGQPFDDPKYFWSRPSATSPFPDRAGASTGSNLDPTNPDLAKAVRGRIDAIRAADLGNAAPIPVDLVTASGSGLDPHISPAGALYQVSRVATARGLEETQVRELVAQYTEGRQWRIFGEPRVNVLRLNLALDGTG